MQFTAKKLFIAVLLISPLWAGAQSFLIPEGSKHLSFLNRLEIKLQTNNALNVTGLNMMSRKAAVETALIADSLFKAGKLALTEVEKYQLQSLLMEHPEFYQGDASSFASKKPLWNSFYKTRANMVEVRDKDFYLVVNPVLQLNGSKELDNTNKLFLNSRGLTLRGALSKKIGFVSSVTDNQERGPDFFQQRVDSLGSVPGMGYFQDFKITAFDYFDARGAVYYTPNEKLDIQFGYDKNFIGDGYRSLFLSNNANSNLFLKVTTRIWKLQYTNLFMELNPQTKEINAGNKLLDRKYASIHHLSLNATPWLNLGLFEAVIFGRSNHFDFTYLNPVIFLRASEQMNGSADNSLVGVNFKANLAHKYQLYGQLLLDEFNLQQLRANTGWWANKWALQAGAKAIDVLGIKHLDLQAEMNVVRPFTYSHYDSIANYTHYNQYLAHPLGSNFAELIGIARYQPHPKWVGQVRAIYWKQGADSTGKNSNVGNNPLKSNNSRSSGDFGYTMFKGISHAGMNVHLLLSYEWKQNLFLEAAALYRHLGKPKGADYPMDSKMVSFGVRWNVGRREYDY